MAEHPVQHDADAIAGSGLAQLLKILVGAQQRVHVEIVGGVVPVVGVSLKDGVEVDVVHPEVMQVGELGLDALEVAAKVIVIEMAAVLIGLPERLRVLVGPVDPVREGHMLVLHPLAEPVGEDLVEHAPLDARRRLEAGVVDGQLPALPLLPGQHPAAHLAPVDLAEVGVQIEIIKVQSHVKDLHVHRKVVDTGGLAVEAHPVVHRLVPGPFLLQDQVGVHIAHLLGDAQGHMHRLPGGQGAEGALVIGVTAVEQAIQVRSFLSKEKRGSRPSVRRMRGTTSPLKDTKRIAGLLI